MSGMKRKRPKAVVWYEVYCHVFAGLNLLTAWEGLQIARNPHGIIGRFSFLSDLATDQDTLDYLVVMVQATGWTFIGVGLFFGIAAVTLPRTPDNRKTWVAHLVHLVFGMSSGVLLPLCLPVFIAWLKPEVKAYYGVPIRADKDPR